MLYEVITPEMENGPEGPRRLAPSTSRRLDCVQNTAGVITSYSIHYTKLYDAPKSSGKAAPAETPEERPPKKAKKAKKEE